MSQPGKPEQTTGVTSAPVLDISHRALQMARMVDRLSPGTYRILVVKDEMDAKDWRIEVCREEVLKRISLPKRYVAE